MNEDALQLMPDCGEGFYISFDSQIEAFTCKLQPEIVYLPSEGYSTFDAGAFITFGILVGMLITVALFELRLRMKGLL